MSSKQEEKLERKELRQTVGTLINRDRVVNFSDAIFAFAATLLVLKIDLPALDPQTITQTFPQALANLAPQYFANIISFLIIGYYWICHHAIFSLVKRIDQRLIWINIVFLIALSFIPFPVDLFGDFNRVPAVVIFYTASIAVVGWLLLAIWLYAAIGRRLVNPHISTRDIWYYICRFAIAPIVFTLSIPLILIDTDLAKVSWLFVIVGIFVIKKLFHFTEVSVIDKATL